MRVNRKIVALFLIAGAITFNSCEKDDTEVTGNDRDKFLGSYASESTGPGGQRNTTMTITTSNSSPNQVKMINFDSDGTTVFADVSESSLSITSQNISGEVYQGSGSISGKTLTIQFTIDDGQSIENRTLVATRP